MPPLGIRDLAAAIAAINTRPHLPAALPPAVMPMMTAATAIMSAIAHFAPKPASLQSAKGGE